ncbi:phosphoesterase, partial [Streptomyces sp. MBT57]|nr:phosphoesterase [Streptomyces sp. MBT57]
MSPKSSPNTSSAAPAADRVRSWLQGRDLAVFQSVAGRHWPGADPLLPQLSRSANHGLLWFGTAIGIAALGSSAAR